MAMITRLSRASRVALVVFGCATAAVGSTAAQTTREKPGGFWKCKARSDVKGEFGGEDPVGLASGKHIPTDCTVRLGDGHGKTYCFASMPSREFFDSELGILDKAEAFWSKDHPARSDQNGAR